MKQLSGQDNSFLEIEGIGIPQHISSVAIYDQSTAPGGAVRFKDILSHLESRLHLTPIFRNKLQRVPMGLDHIDNVPGPPNQLYFAGAQIVEGFGIGPLVPGVGLFHTASSSVMNKQGKINFSFWACRDMLPNPDFYKQCIEETYAGLKSAALPTRGKPRAKTKAKTKAKAA